MGDHKHIESLLQRHMGLYSSSIGSESFARAINRRMTECGLSDIREYLNLLQVSKRELGELCEEMVVSETWFFRDGEPFVFLRRHMLTRWLLEHGSSVLRVLSIPCATGEEAYSAAMTLLDAGLTSRQFHIDALDISRRALLSARRAIYTKNSFRGDDLSYRERYFDRMGLEYKLHDAIRSAVHFMWGNLANPSFLVDQPPYDVIFCRNLLIYFDSATRWQAFQTLDRLLKNSGLLFLGHTEILQIPPSTFRPVQHPRAFACHKVGNAPMDEDSANNGGPAWENPPRPAFRKSGPGGVFASDSIENTTSTLTCPPPIIRKRKEKNGESGERPTFVSSTGANVGSSSQLLDTAAAFADQGRLGEAAALCERAIAEYGASARAYLLLGLISEGAGDAQSAVEYYNKAVYLDPSHHEALIHLALLAEHRGDVSAAALFRQRAERARRAQQERVKK